MKRNQRVFYTENGAKDTGTVTGIVLRKDAGKYRTLYRVTWDDGSETDLYDKGQLTAV